MASAPVVIDVTYKDDNSLVEQRIDDTEADVGGRRLTLLDRHHLKDYPTVYIIRSRQHHVAKASGYEFDHFTVYVGETNAIVRRTTEHYGDESTYRTERNREAWRTINSDDCARMLVIGHRHFNKSLTLDLENTFVSYLLAARGNITLVNSRGNPQGDYYTHDELTSLTSQTWRKLNRYQPEIFPAESVIRDSAIFKASPFHTLGKDQLEAESAILQLIRRALAREAEGEPHSLILVEGVAGTGKTVLLSHLFLQLVNEFEDHMHADGTPVVGNLLVNHDEQLTVYNSIMKRLGLQKRNDEIVMKPTAFINRHSEPGHGSGLDRQDYPADPVDVVLIDEAHLLLNQGNQGYRGSRNMLLDILKRARVVVAVYDPNQILRHSQEIDEESHTALFPLGRFVPDGRADSGEATVGATRTLYYKGLACSVTNVQLRQQFRIDASDEVIAWIDDFASGRGIGPIPRDPEREGHVPYEIHVFDSPFELREAIRERALEADPDTGLDAKGREHGLSRVLATYDWGYSTKKKPQAEPTWNVRIYEEDLSWIALDNDPAPTDTAPLSNGSKPRGRVFSMPWNYQLPPLEGESDTDKAWAEQPHTLDECGSIYTIQGFDLNVAGVIIGPSVKYRDGRIVFDPSASKNSQAINGSNEPERNLRNELNVLIKRGVHGLYLFAVDAGLQQHLKNMAAAGRKEDSQ